MQINDSNYYSLEANKEYMSVSQYKDFLKCEEAAMAKIKGHWVEPSSDALLLGSYVHAWNEGAIEQFKNDNPDMFSSRGATKGQLKSNFLVGDEMIKALEDDPFCMYVLQGEKEVIMTAELFGAPWKIKMDSYNAEKERFSDLKTVKDFERVWNPISKSKVTFVEANGYITQMAVYREIEALATGRKNRVESFIVAVTKQSPPDKAILSFNLEDYEQALGDVESHMERIIEVKYGGVEPVRCGHCEYCRATKKVERIIHYSDL